MSDTVDFTGSVVEEVVLNLFEGFGYSALNGPTIAPERPNAERAPFAELILLDRLQVALVRINRTIPADAIEEALRKATRVGTPALEENIDWTLKESVKANLRRLVACGDCARRYKNRYIAKYWSSS